MAGGIFIGSTPIVEVIHGFPDAPTVSIVPVDPSVTEGDTINFVATATGYGALTYQWFLDGVAIDGAVAATYDRVTVIGDDAKVITCEVYNPHTQSALSAGSTMTVAVAVYAPTVVTQPVAATVANGATGTFTAAFDGLPVPTVQWQLNAVDVAGATGLSYTTPAADYLANDGDSYTCIATNSEGSVTTNAALLTVTIPAAPVMTFQPEDNTVNNGAVASFPSQADGYHPMSNEWFLNGVAIPGSNIATYQTPVNDYLINNGDEYHTVITDAAGQPVTSDVATLTVSTPAAPAITTQPAPITVANGATAAFSIVATGYGTLTYQWYKDDVLIDGATAAAYTTPANDYLANNGDVFHCVVTDSVGTPQTSTDAALTVSLPAAPTVTIAPIDPSVTEGDVVAFVATAVAYGTLYYTWQQSVNGADSWTNVGDNSPNYSHTAVLSDPLGQYIRCIVDDASGQAAISAASLMTVAVGELWLHLDPADISWVSDPAEVILTGNEAEIHGTGTLFPACKSTPFVLEAGVEYQFTASYSNTVHDNLWWYVHTETPGGVLEEIWSSLFSSAIDVTFTAVGDETMIKCSVWGTAGNGLGTFTGGHLKKKEYTPYDGVMDVAVFADTIGFSDGSAGTLTPLLTLGGAYNRCLNLRIHAGASGTPGFIFEMVPAISNGGWNTLTFITSTGVETTINRGDCTYTNNGGHQTWQKADVDQSVIGAAGTVTDVQIR
ncbi:MAG: hypothetical protein DRI24_24560 [Deltaproteobacteria bacterium]|nr:MAG: hypothetical protein DRI24_24560 [Deltaproteobacteria bacterium]